MLTKLYRVSLKYTILVEKKVRVSFEKGPESAVHVQKADMTSGERIVKCTCNVGAITFWTLRGEVVGKCHFCYYTVIDQKHLCISWMCVRSQATFEAQKRFPKFHKIKSQL